MRWRALFFTMVFSGLFGVFAVQDPACAATAAKPQKYFRSQAAKPKTSSSKAATAAHNPNKKKTASRRHHASNAAAAAAALAPAAGEAAATPASTAPSVASGAASAPETPPPTPAAPVHVTAASNPSGELTLQFSWGNRVASAAFIRGRTLWIVFGAPAPLVLDAVKKDHGGWIKNIDQEIIGSNTVLRAGLAREGFVRTAQKPGEHSWVVTLAAAAQPPAQTLTPRVNMVPSVGPHLLLPAAETSDALNAADPSTGERFIIIPSYTPGLGVAKARRFVDFALLPTAQGIAVQKINDTTQATPVRGAIKISAPDGLMLSTNLPPVPEEVTKDTAKTEASTLFPYEQWKLPAGTDLVTERQRLFQEITSSTPQKAMDSRRRMAELALAEGQGAEALASLKIIHDLDAAYYTQHHLSALEGAANFLLYRMGDAAQNFNAAELSALPEITMWRAIMTELLGAAATAPPLPAAGAAATSPATNQADVKKEEKKPAVATAASTPAVALVPPPARFDYMANIGLIAQYPPVMRERVGVIGADAAINRKDYNTALKVLEHLSKSADLSAATKKYVDFLLAKISAETGQGQVAIDLWGHLAEDIDDRFIRARAEYSLVNLLLQQNKISKKEAITRLDRLRIVWRGDSLEMNLLMLLGRLGLETQDYATALRAFREVVANYPEMPETLAITQKMSETFLALFNQGVADSMPPVEALALYYEFRELTPIGEEGDRMIRNLADRLAGLDLLDRAASLLNHQVRFRLEREERSRVGARLALLNLLNHQPRQALEALQISSYGANPAELNSTRNALAARAMMELGQPEKGLGLVESDASRTGRALKIDILWAQRDWPKLIETAEKILGTRDDITKPLDDAETGYLLKLALAYAFEGDHAQLQYLRDYFGPLMAEGARKDMLLFITDTGVPIDPRRFDKVTQEISRVESFLGTFRNRMQKDGLSQAIN